MTNQGLSHENLYTISIHTFLAEGDFHPEKAELGDYEFQSTPSSRKVTWEVTQLEYNPIISIHTFLAEGDLPFVSHVTVISVISIHTFLAEGDHLLRRCNTYVSIFQSTPSSRKVTASFLDLAFKPAKFQSTPSSRKVTTAMH